VLAIWTAQPTLFSSYIARVASPPLQSGCCYRRLLERRPSREMSVNASNVKSVHCSSRSLSFYQSSVLSKDNPIAIAHQSIRLASSSDAVLSPPYSSLIPDTRPLSPCSSLHTNHSSRQRLCIADVLPKDYSCTKLAVLLLSNDTAI